MTADLSAMEKLPTDDKALVVHLKLKKTERVNIYLRSEEILNAHYVGYNKVPTGYYLVRRTIFALEPLGPSY